MLPSALFALPLLAAPAAADLADRAITVGIACFGYAGASYPNNTLCPNSKGCCGYQATCLSNKLCHNPSDGAGTFVRGPCSVNGWDDDCAQICKYNETLNQGFLPRVTVCDDGSLCCNNEPTCCNDGKGIFLDGTGKVVSKLSTDVITSYPPIQTTSGTATDRITATPTSSASTTSRTTTTSQTTTAAAATSSAAASTDDDDSSNRIGLRVGLGVGIPAAAVVAVASVFLLLRRKHARQRRLDLIDSGLQQPMKPVPSVSGSYPTHYTSELAVTSPGTSYQASELPVEHVQRFELDAQPYQDRR